MSEQVQKCPANENAAEKMPQWVGLEVERVKRAAKGYVRLFERVFAGKASPRASIKAHCLQCRGFSRTDVASCRVFQCPLWHHRPKFGVGRGAMSEQKCSEGLSEKDGKFEV